MALTMTPGRFEEIRRLVRERQLAKKAAEIDAETRWSEAPAFTDVDSFLAYLDRQAAPKGCPARRKRG
jgi:hypothetical protein